MVPKEFWVSHLLGLLPQEITQLISREPEQEARRIILNDDIPVYQPARRLSYAEQKSVNKHIEEWLEQGIVRPSSSEYASPIVLL
ncbi:transposon Ty3-G Gag-Pol polyprotein [Trichonephila clavipes]|nr:transposon Ty3-G Gag-Pol polyprotein [Trichonephila clavipes]